MGSVNVRRLPTPTEIRHDNTACLFLALVGTGLACALVLYVPVSPSVLAAAVGFPIALAAALALPAFQCIPLGPRIVLILLALRPLMDAGGLSEAPSSNFTLQAAYSVVFAVLLLMLWATGGYRYEFTMLLNKYVLLLLGLTIIVWPMGGLSAGANGFIRTAWGLLVALLLGPLFRTERQIDIFVRTVFYSSIFVLLGVSLNLDKGFYQGEVWRLGGQYVIPNTLAGVAFALFAYGLYVLGRARTVRGKLVSLSLLALLAVVIVLTQSTTVGALMLISICLWLWSAGYRRLLYTLAVPLLALFIGLGVAAGWRVASIFSLEEGEFAPGVVNLTGRTYLWGETLQQYANASLLHKFIGLGWGTVFKNFESLALQSSVTENSFLWFLVGTGILGLIAFSAYLIWTLRRAWSGWHRASNEFERRLALLAFLVAVTFVIEGFTTDLAIAPVSSGYLYAILSIFVYHSLSTPSGTGPISSGHEALAEAKARGTSGAE
jgi:O-antigen ligase